MAATLREAGFKSSKADPDVWLHPATKANGDRYYKYILIYVDDILALSKDLKKIMDYLESKYTLKDGSMKEPDQYLGASVTKWTIKGLEDSEKPRWAMVPDVYVKCAIANVETELHAVSLELTKRASTPFSSGYRPELDTMKELNAERAAYFQGLIGVLRWCVELGCVDILTETALLSRFLMNPREGHLNEVFHIFSYLKSHDHSAMVFDDTEPELQCEFHMCNWSEYYLGAKEAIPPNAPEPCGHGVTTMYERRVMLMPIMLVVI